jgi:hypothetical protein
LQVEDAVDIHVRRLSDLVLGDRYGILHAAGASVSVRPW